MPNAPQKLTSIITGYWRSQAVYVAARLGIADLLAHGPRNVSDLADDAGCDEDALFRLLRALAGIGVFAETEPRTFAMTPLAEPLREDAENSQRALALMMGEEQYQAWGDLLYSVRTGETAFEKRFGQPIFEYLSAHPQKARIFDAAMTGIHGREAAAVVEAYDFSSVNVLADVGGGNGSQITTVLQRHPAIQGILYDLPHVVEHARRWIEDAGLKDRCRLEGGSFFDAVPDGADAYLLRHIIHDWNDDRSLVILQNIRRVIPSHGRLLIVESVIPPGNDPLPAKFLDLTMLVVPGGKERTREEYASLLAAARFPSRGSRRRRRRSASSKPHLFERTGFLLAPGGCSGGQWRSDCLALREAPVRLPAGRSSAHAQIPLQE